MGGIGSHKHWICCYVLCTSTATCKILHQHATSFQRPFVRRLRKGADTVKSQSKENEDVNEKRTASMKTLSCSPITQSNVLTQPDLPVSIGRHQPLRGPELTSPKTAEVVFCLHHPLSTEESRKLGWCHMEPGSMLYTTLLKDFVLRSFQDISESSKRKY